VGRGQQSDLGLEPLSALPPLELVHRCPLPGWGAVLDKLRNRLVWLGAAGLDGVQRRVAHDLQQPRAKGPLAAKAPNSMESPQERVLGDVVGVVRPNDPKRHSVGDRLMSPHEYLEGLVAARSGLLDEFAIGVDEDGYPGTELTRLGPPARSLGYSEALRNFPAPPPVTHSMIGYRSG
jgi:hypothetical protein